MNYWTASRWLSFVVAILIIAALIATLLMALAEAQERSEKLIVEVTYRNMRTGLQLAMGQAMMRGNDHEIAEWVGSNPLRWLGREPEGYLGECDSRGTQALAEGAWCFDRERRELVYRPRHTRHLRLPGESEGKKILRWRVMAAQPQSAGVSAGLRVEYVTAVEWVLN
jgi:hypothetical protein